MVYLSVEWAQCPFDLVLRNVIGMHPVVYMKLLENFLKNKAGKMGGKEARKGGNISLHLEWLHVPDRVASVLQRN